MKALFPDNKPFFIAFIYGAHPSTANKQIIKYINKWQIDEDIHNAYSLQEYLGFSDKQYSLWVSGKRDAAQIVKRYNLIRKYFWRPLYFIKDDLFNPETYKRKIKYS